MRNACNYLNTRVSIWKCKNFSLYWRNKDCVADPFQLCSLKTHTPLGLFLCLASFHLLHSGVLQDWTFPVLCWSLALGLVFFSLQKCSGTIEVNYEMLKPLSPLWLQATLRDLTQKTASGILLSAGNAAWFPRFFTWCVLKEMVNAEKAPYYKIYRW